MVEWSDLSEQSGLAECRGAEINSGQAGDDHGIWLLHGRQYDRSFDCLGDGFWLAIWNDTRLSGPTYPIDIVVPPHNVTLTLGTTAAKVVVFDPLIGTSSVQSFSNTATAAISVPDHPVLVEIIPSGGGDPITIPDRQAKFTTSVSNATITATAGDHIIFIGGTNDVLVATGGKETVQAYHGHNSITTGAGNDSIRFAGSGNTVDAGAGSNVLFNTGSKNTIILPAAAHGSDSIRGPSVTESVLSNGDRLDLRPALAATTWTGDRLTISNYLRVTSYNGNSTVKVVADGSPEGTAVTIANLQNTETVGLAEVLAHALF
jgi:Ca2+-binding RTX toxin-like protein